MRRGRILTGASLLLAALSMSGAPAALAASPQDICTDLRDGTVNGTYTAAEWTAYFNDPTIQGYGCGGAIIPPQTPVTPVTPQQPATPVTPAAPVTPAVPLTPAQPAAVVAVVKGAHQTVVSKPAAPKPGVKGANHTVKTPVAAHAAAPLATTKTRGTLPFTGAQLGLFALVGLALLAAGIALRSTARPSQKL